MHHSTKNNHNLDSNIICGNQMISKPIIPAYSLQ